MNQFAAEPMIHRYAEDLGRPFPSWESRIIGVLDGQFDPADCHVIVAACACAADQREPSNDPWTPQVTDVIARYEASGCDPAGIPAMQMTAMALTADGHGAMAY